MPSQKVPEAPAIVSENTLTDIRYRLQNIILFIF